MKRLYVLLSNETILTVSEESNVDCNHVICMQKKSNTYSYWHSNKIGHKVKH